MLPQAVTWLAGDWAGGEPLDLAKTLVVVPTRQSGRRLREAIAGHAAERGQAAFPPRVLTPEALVTQSVVAPTASRLDALLAWAEVFRGLELEDYREVFPVDPPARNFAWALRLAQQFARLQATLAEGGFTLSDVARRAGDDFPEGERWRQLGELEQRHAEQLAARQLRDAQAAKIAAAHAPPALDGITRIVVLATPDPLPLALQVLAAHAATWPVEILVFAPQSEAENFDAWGRPLAEAWAGRELVLPEFARRVHLCADPAAQAERLTAAAKNYPQPDGALALGVADAELLPLLEGELARAGLTSFNPEGRPRRAEPLYQLLATLAQLAREPSWEAVAALARCPDFLAYLSVRSGGGFSAAKFLAGLDELRAQHLPADLETALDCDGGRLRELGVMAELRQTLVTGAFPENAVAALAELFSGRRLDLVREADARLEEAASAWTEVLRTCAEALVRFPSATDDEWWELALRLYGDEARTEDKPAGALELQGWLELLFEDAPHLAIAGLNDGLVPEAVVGDAFLPESLRARLGLKTNAARFARDAYLISAMATCRPRLDVFFGKTSVAGEPLRPSRLLLRCADAELPARVAFLFREPAAARPGLPWTRAWKLALPRVAPPTRVSVTALRAWLACPLRFYLRHVLRMAAVDPAKEELDALDFGILVHGALEALGRDEGLRACADEKVLRDFLHLTLDRLARERFGPEPALPLVIQLESARQRLGKAAEIEAGERAAGWRTVAVEQKFTFEVGGLTVSGKIDRVDRHAETGAVRVLDYKTSDKPATPVEAHLRSLRREETPPEWALVEVGEKSRVWIDLQLPLYEHALAAEFGGAVVCGYFNLPKAVSETGVVLWDGLSPELRESARRCAEGVCAAIGAGEFWPPRELTGRDAEMDEFAALFQQGAAASVAWEETP